MSATCPASVRTIDVAGGLVVVACLAGFFWITFTHNDRAKTRIDDLRTVIETAQRDIRALEQAHVGQKRTLEDHQAALAQTGRLPVQAPTEEYFQTLASLAAKNSLRVIRLEPLGARTYPGLLEQRYAYEVAGSMPNIVRFLQDIERAEFWADVSYLNLSRGNGTEDYVVGNRRAELTLSLFSAPLQPAEPGGKGT